MKNITAAVLLLLFVFSTKSCYLGVANAASQPVLDSDGDELRTGVKYYIVSAKRGSGGGLDLVWSRPNRCPPFVVQQANDTQFGRPVQFFPANKNDNVIRLSTDVKVVFFPNRDLYCRQGTTWKLDNYDPSSGKWWVRTGTVNGAPGPQTLLSWFKIRKYGSRFYRLSFCPLVCDWCVTLCNDITRYSFNKQLRWGLTRQSGWPFVFIKASKVKQPTVETPSE